MTARRDSLPGNASAIPWMQAQQDVLDQLLEQLWVGDPRRGYIASCLEALGGEIAYWRLPSYARR
jgi:hypothetical protein